MSHTHGQGFVDQITKLRHENYRLRMAISLIRIETDPLLIVEDEEARSTAFKLATEALQRDGK